MEIETKGTAYLQGIKGLDYLAKINNNLAKPMNVLKKFLSGNPLRKSLYLTFNEGTPKITKGVYQLKVNPKNETFLNSLRDELSKEKQIIDTTNTVQGQIITFKSGFQLYASGKKLGNVIGEDGKAVAATTPKTISGKAVPKDCKSPEAILVLSLKTSVVSSITSAIFLSTNNAPIPSINVMLTILSHKAVSTSRNSAK